jgi:hypothetical protein
VPKRRGSAKTPGSTYVEHPRYGCVPHTSGLEVPVEYIRSSFWSLQREKFYPESVLVADLSKQNFAVFARPYYVDIERQCRACGSAFLFFAKEQKYWYESLQFFVDADCVRCPVCRRASRVPRQRIRRYSQLIGKAVHSREDLERLVDAARYLFAAGNLRNVDTLGAIKNKALKSIPNYSGTAKLVAALAEARSRGSAA